MGRCADRDFGSPVIDSYLLTGTGVYGDYRRGGSRAWMPAPMGRGSCRVDTVKDSPPPVVIDFERESTRGYAARSELGIRRRSKDAIPFPGKIVDRITPGVSASRG